ncbi:putative leucine-rich repeat-containing protein [Corchorus olitorius]|uniref:Leucine-rich repeat-containing protein n=1 Tax=Corchorus olitorius TaxID=93759 RepID=A0A1R3GVG2_9ROSI|nr:putative leucine-rich repeat-containing protein [Corchorus olitorius]
MAENNNALTLLKDYLKVYGNARPAFSIFMPGTEIPESFKFKHHGDESTKIPLPPNIWNDGQWMGVALCCILASASGNDAWGYRECIYVKPVIHGRKHPRPVTGYIFESDYSRCQIMKEHIWLIYWRRDELYPSFPLDENDGETKNSSNTSLAGEQYCDEIEFQFQHYNSTVRPKVKKYGFQILYGKDLEGMDVESTEQHISLSSPNFNDGIHQDTPNGPTGYVFEFEETGSGESGSDEDIPDPLSSLRRPHPKRLENNMKSNKRPREDETHFGLVRNLLSSTTWSGA